MGSRSWGVELWDQTDYLLQHENEQIALHDQHIRLLSELQKLVVDFGKKYRRTVAGFVPKKKQSSPGSNVDSKLTYNTVLTDSLASFLELATAFEGYGADLQNSVIAPLKGEFDKHRKLADKVASDYAKHTQHREREKKRLEETWRAHVTALKDKQKAETAHTQAQSDSNISKEEQAKAESVFAAKKNAFIETQQTYAAEMAKFNDNQRHYFTHHLYSLVTDLEMMDRRRAALTKDLLTKCASLGDGLAGQLTEASSSLRKTVSRIDPEEDCKTVLEVKKSEFVYPVDLPFLNLAQCTQATLEDQSALVALMLGTTANGGATKNTGGNKTGSMLHNIFAKSRNTASDGNALQTPFVSGIGYKPIKESDMTVIQVNDRIKALKANQDKVQGAMDATQRLLDSYRQNPSLGNQTDTEATIAKLQRQTYSLTELINRLESRFETMGGDKALAAAQSSLECSNPFGISSPTDTPAFKPNRPTSMPKQTTRSDSYKPSRRTSDDSDVEDGGAAAARGGGNPASGEGYVGQATCKYDYTGDGPEFLSAKAGESFYVVEMDDEQSGWTAVVSADGTRHGYLPTAYMSITPY